MRIPMYMFPGYVTIESSRRFSPKFFEWLDQKGVVIERRRFDGKDPKTITSNGPAIVRASSVMDCSVQDLLDYCNRNGHLLFYNDMLVDSPVTLRMQRGDEQQFALLVEAAEKFLASLPVPA
jgi:hypothetical protein